MVTQLRLGRADEAEAAACLIYASDPPYYDFWLGPQAAALACLEKLWRAPVGSLSHNRFQVWRERDELIALVSHYSAAQEGELAAEDVIAQAQLRGDLTELQRREAMLAWLFPHLPDEVWYLCTLAVAASQRGQGVGAQILDEIAATARAHGATSLQTDVDSGNPGAVNFYRRHDFGIVAETRVPMLEAFALPASLRMAKPLRIFQEIRCRSRD